MKARHKDTGEIIELAEEGIISRDGRRFCWYQVDIIPEPIDECNPSLPSNLDEVAERIVVSLVPTLGQKYEDGSYVQGTRDFFSRDELIGLVKAGAEWAKNCQER